MCDYRRGELLVSHDPEDPAARALMQRLREGEWKSHGIDVDGNLEERVKHLDLALREGVHPTTYLLRVPPGQEVFKMNILHFHYQHEMLKAVAQGDFWDGWDESRRTLLISPNHRLSPAFAFATARHCSYRRLVQSPKSSATTRKIAILDSGVDDPTRFNIAGVCNFTDDALRSDVTDDYPREHGTAVAGIIRDLCPKAPLVIYKVVDSLGEASEWDTIAALAADSGAGVINASLEFGLGDTHCPTCGRERHSSRSAVFQKILEQVTASGAIVVCAAGNQHKPELSYPARFGCTVAIVAVRENLDLADFTNTGDTDEEGSAHCNVFVAPGGYDDSGGAAREAIGTAGNGDELFGTSFAAAYATAVIAHVCGVVKPGASADQILVHLRSQADATLPGHSAATHGHGLIQP